MDFDATEKLVSPTGATLALRHQAAVPDAKAIVLVNHGLAEHSARYAPFAAFLACRGYHVYAHDHRGHGTTVAPDAALGRFSTRNGPDRVIADCLAVRDHAASRHPGLPIILFGHSMGGMIAAAVAEARPVAFNALAIWNSALNPGAAGAVGAFLIGLERFFKGSDVPSTLAPRLTFDAWAKTVPNARTDFDWLSRDSAVVDRYVADPLCGSPPSVSMWLDVLSIASAAGSTTALSNLPRTMPINLVGGGQDPATAGGKAMRWLEGRLNGMGFPHVALTVYPDMRHETLNEIGREEAMKAFAAWADAAIR
jgi:alpha-beta hydrolase superfamily lysophospholipase